MRAAAILAVACLATTAACSNTQSPINRPGASGTSTAALVNGVQKVEVDTDDRYRFTPSTVVVHPGQVEITLVHKGEAAPHDLSVTDIPGAAVPLVYAGQSHSVTFRANTPGSYQFVCTIHVRQGQTGTLVVLPT